ncbi:MAG: SUMF1/EgtB/PvdO family nonheme iron enzyme [Labilithrix sp.]|nr:SUMF1/EgtB/PvdO family nonheme iron enzyme [Labilithrix sp.]MCW5810434.1 SUMF1/EgtB/PvdO family nonheme iron enzyme [Labilithrix sp.]
MLQDADPAARRALAAIGALLAVGIASYLFVRCYAAEPEIGCAAGFVHEGTRCFALPPCPAPLVETEHGCDAPERELVAIPETTVVIGPSDWEAEGRVAPRTVHVAAFALDRLEVTAGRFCRAQKVPCDDRDPARAATNVPLAAARAYCAARGGRLPAEDEWLAAAAGDKPRRYPWGDTGAVCRRAAWGVERGPCAHGATGPDTVGAHPDGATPLGVHDLAGNVAEWVDAPSAVVRGGSWRTSLATELRTWPRTEVSAEVASKGDPTIGFRCAYGAVR